MVAFCCCHCRATIDEVETDVVEIEAKLDKVRWGSSVQWFEERLISSCLGIWPHQSPLKHELISDSREANT